MSIKGIFVYVFILGLIIFLADEAITTIYREVKNDAKGWAPTVVGQDVFSPQNVKALVVGPTKQTVVGKDGKTIWGFFVESKAAGLGYSWDDYNQAWQQINGTYMMVLGTKKIDPVPISKAPIPSF